MGYYLYCKGHKKFPWYTDQQGEYYIDLIKGCKDKNYTISFCGVKVA